MEPAAHRTWLLGGLLIAGAVLAPLAQVLDFPLLNFDDRAYVTANPVQALPLLDAVQRSFAEPYYGAWHPLTLITLRLIHAAGGGAPAYHAVVLGLYLGVALVTWGLLRRWSDGAPGRAGGAALVAALWFAAHPGHAEAAAWVSSLKEGLSVGLALLCLWAADRTPRAGVRTVAVVVLGALAMGAKGTLIVLPLLVAGLARARGRAVRAHATELLALSLVALPTAWLNWGAHQAEVVAKVGGPSFDPVQGFGGVARLFGHALWPFRLAAAYDPPGVGLAVAGGLTVGALTVAAAQLARLDRMAAFGLGFALTTMLPVAGFAPLVFVGADRYLLAPTVGIAITLARLWQLVPARGLWLGAPIVLAFAGALHTRAAEYASDLVLWEAGGRAAPGLAQAQANLGSALTVAHRYDEAEAAFLAEVAAAPEQTKPRRDLYMFHVLRAGASAADLRRFGAAWDALMAKPTPEAEAALVRAVIAAGASEAAVHVHAGAVNARGG